MDATHFVEVLSEHLDIDFFTGVPDSLLSPFTNELMSKYEISNKHIIAANEGNAVGLAAGYHLATGKIPCVYMQNSGQGNIVNPFTSLLAPEVYKIPCLFIIGWRGEPGTKDEPQHVFQGQITTQLCDLLQIQNEVITAKTTEDELVVILDKMCVTLKEGKCVALVIEKGALSTEKKVNYKNEYVLSREAAIEYITGKIGNDIVVSTTGKASRELFEIRESRGESHECDFLTVGSMGHSSSIALSIALQKPQKRVWCIDGDGAMLMHMGAIALIGANNPSNFVHVVLNNESHETVGGLPTVAGKMDVTMIAKGCGYPNCYSVCNIEELDKAINIVKGKEELSLIEIKVALGARKDLGRPTTTAEDNKNSFMNFLRSV